MLCARVELGNPWKSESSRMICGSVPDFCKFNTVLVQRSAGR